MAWRRAGPRGPHPERPRARLPGRRGRATRRAHRGTAGRGAPRGRVERRRPRRLRARGMTAGETVGILPVDKPEGPTSHDVVAMARRGLQTRRVGHTGTLDPFASGLLLLCVGSATRLSSVLTGLDKEYDAVAVLGVTTRTHDREGSVVSETDASHLTDRAIAEAVERLRGVQWQRPPAFSAKKVGGEAAHRRARRGETV